LSPEGKTKQKSLLMVAILAIIWGSSFILMKLSLFDPSGDEMYTWDQVASMRIFIATLFLVPFAYKFRREFFGKHWKPLLAVGLFGNGIPAYLFTASELQLDSSLAGMLNSMVPVFTLIIAIIFFKTRISTINTIGVFIGLTGAICISASGGVEVLGDDLIYVLFIVGATICYAISLNVIKNMLHDLSPLAITSIAFTYVSIPIGIHLLTTDIPTRMTTNPYGYEAFGYTVILAAVGTALALVIFNYFVKVSTTIFSASITYLIPIVAIAWGVVFGESITMFHILGMLVILLGVYLVNKPVKT
jgi:drug/metabolite transporter (DMT)-like permease